MRKLRLLFVVVAITLVGVAGSLIVGHENVARAADNNSLGKAVMTAGSAGAKAVVVDITAPGQVSPKTHVVYDFEKKTVSLIQIDGDHIIVKEVTSYLTPTKRD